MATQTSWKTSTNNPQRGSSRFLPTSVTATIGVVALLLFGCGDNNNAPAGTGGAGGTGAGGTTQGTGGGTGPAGFGGSGGAGGVGTASGGAGGGIDASVSSTGGSGGSSTACGAPGEPCCGGNSCNDNGCCVPVTPDGGRFSTRTCIAVGQACEATGVSGTCSASTSSCVDTVTNTPCGGVGQACCGGSVDGGGFGAAAAFCTAGGTRCTDNTCVACGGADQACCEGGTSNQCQASLVCATTDGGQVCTACGGSGQPCCAGDTCNTGLGCNNPGRGAQATCEECGASGQACCAGNNCQSGLGCLGTGDGGANTCQPCGAAGQTCCPGFNNACETGLSCTVSSSGDVCAVCGDSGQACCGAGNNGTCNDGFACTGRSAADGVAGTCTACGGSGQPCCGGATPCSADGESCVVQATGNVCAACGGSGQACCGAGNNGTCDDGFACTGRSASDGVAGTCAACGGSGQPCCAGATPCSVDGESCVVQATGNVCAACGDADQACCGTRNNGTCNTGFVCSGRTANEGAAGTCAACGGDGQPCCPVTGGPGADGGVAACEAPLECILASEDNQCGSCGAAGESCCGTGFNGTCSAGLVCSGRSRTDGTPGTCGEESTVDAGVMPDAPLATPDAPAGG
jgi:hypothetical protein